MNMLTEAAVEKALDQKMNTIPYKMIGQDVSEQLEYVPARFKVIRHVRPKLACVGCETIFQATAPSRPIARGMAGPGLLAHVMVAKLIMHRPFSEKSP